MNSDEQEKCESNKHNFVTREMRMRYIMLITIFINGHFQQIANELFPARKKHKTNKH